MPALVTQELDLLHAQDSGCGALLLLADFGELGILLLRILSALRPVRDDPVRVLRPHAPPIVLRAFSIALRRAPAVCLLLFRHELRLRRSRPAPEDQNALRRDLLTAPREASGIACWIGAHKTSSCSVLRRDLDPITRPPNAAVFAAAQPWLPLTRIGTVTTAARAAASSAVRAPPSATAFARALETSSGICQGCASSAHWFALSRPMALT